MVPNVVHLKRRRINESEYAKCKTSIFFQKPKLNHVDKSMFVAYFYKATPWFDFRYLEQE